MERRHKEGIVEEENKKKRKNREKERKGIKRFLVLRSLQR